MKKTPNKSRLRRIKEIPNEIKTLVSELESLLLEDQGSESPAESIQSNIRIGDRVQILSSQSNLKGSKATVIGTTTKRFILQVLPHGPIVYRAKHNVKKIQDGAK